MANTVGQTQTVQVPNYSGVNIQIFNPSAVAPGGTVPGASVNAPTYTTTPSYPSNYYTQNLAQPAQSVQPAQHTEPAQQPAKNTEKRQIVQLTDDYIRTLEEHLSNNENKQIRLMGAKEVLLRLQEDESRKDDPALNALINKMLKDPYEPVKFIAMAALESRAAAGNHETVQLLRHIQDQGAGCNKNTLNGKEANKVEDSLKATDILLKMSGKTVEKEFEVKDKPHKEKNEKNEKE